MTPAGWITMSLACLSITGLLLWCIRKVVTTPEAPQHLRAPADIDAHDEE